MYFFKESIEIKDLVLKQIRSFKTGIVYMTPTHNNSCFMQIEDVAISLSCVKDKTQSWNSNFQTRTIN